MTFAKRVRQRRKKLRLSQIELAKMAKVSPTWITKIEGGSIPSIPIVLNIAKALKEDEEEFIKLVNEEKLKKDREMAKKRELIYHSPLSADEIEKILKREINERQRKKIKRKSNN